MTTLYNTSVCEPICTTFCHADYRPRSDSSSDGVHLNIFLEYVPGGSVATLLKNYGAFEEALVRNFVRQILQGLSYLHERDIIHRDIKGGNILVDNKGGIKISDFGISKKVEDSILTSARVHRPSLQGSVFWMAPEVVKQTSYTLKADIWSVGCLVVEMLTGEHPWAQLTQMQAIFKVKPFSFLECRYDFSIAPPSLLLSYLDWFVSKACLSFRYLSRRGRLPEQNIRTRP